MTSDQLSAALQAEYLYLQRTIEDFDARTLTIKAWSITFSFVAIAGAFASHSRIPFLLSAASALIFWMLEVQWKIFQAAYYERSSQIEAHFRGDQLIEHPFQIGTSWYAAWRSKRITQIPRIAGWPHVALPHIVVMGMGVTLWVLSGMQVVKV